MKGRSLRGKLGYFGCALNRYLGINSVFALLGSGICSRFDWPLTPKISSYGDGSFDRMKRIFRIERILPELRVAL
jgi:hypothetical protein